MQAIEDLRRQQAGAQDLLQVVRTMRAIAVASIREFELAEEALASYESAGAQGLALALAEPSAFRASPHSQHAGRRDAEEPLGLIALGSDHGLVGRFNESLGDRVREIVAQPREVRVIVLGVRLAARLDDLSPRPEAEWAMPRTARAMPDSAAEVLAQVGQWEREGVTEVDLIHNTWTPERGYAPHRRRLLPLDPEAITAEYAWPRQTRPMILGQRDVVAAELLDQFLRTTVVRALTHSLLAENEARLAATRGAEHNVRERIDDLRREYRHAYQGAETEELLDVVSGFEAITSGR